MVYHLIKFGCKKISSSADMVETVISDQMSPYCDPELEDSKQIFLPMMLHHHTKSGYRRFSSCGDIIQMNIHWNSEPFCDLDLNKAIQSFHKTIHLMMMYHRTKSSCKRINSSDNILPWPLRQQTNLFERQSGSYWCITISGLVVKGSAIKKI